MSTIGELISEKTIPIVPGMVFLTWDIHTTPPKEKIHIIVAINSEEAMIATVRINSKLNINVYRDLDSQLHCISLKANDCDFLNHNSVVDCNIITKYPLKKISQLLSKETNRIKGAISEDLLKDIKLRLASARGITPNDKAKFGLK